MKKRNEKFTEDQIWQVFLQMVRILKNVFMENQFVGQDLLVFSEESIYLKIPYEVATERLRGRIMAVSKIIQVKLFSLQLVFGLSNLDEMNGLFKVREKKIDGFYPQEFTNSKRNFEFAYSFHDKIISLNNDEDIANLYQRASSIAKYVSPDRF